MKKWKECFKKWSDTCLKGEVTVPKTYLWLAGAVCLLAGIVYGLRVAPMTHGVMIGCNNGDRDNNNGNSDNYYEGGMGEEEED